MNAAFFEDQEFDLEIEMVQGKQRPQEKFRMARRPQDDMRKRPKQFNGIHRRRVKKIQL